MTLQHQTDELSLTPFKKELTDYSWPTFRSDACAAMSVAMITVPQAMAYALLAGLPLSCGLFAAIYSSFIAALFGSSRQLVVGPSNAIAILVQTGISEILFTYYRNLSGAERDAMAMQLLVQLAFLVGIFQIIVAGFKLGRMTQFISHSVVVAYITGTALAVMINQSFTILGIPRLLGVNSLYEKGSFLFSHLQLTHLPTLFIGISSLLVLIILKRLNKRIPAGVVMLAFSGMLVYAVEPIFQHFELQSFDPYHEELLHTVMLVGDSGVLSDVLPSIQWPMFNMAIINALLPTAFAMALLSVMETTSVAKTIAAGSGQRLSNNQEILGIGLGNLVSSFVAGLPVSGSLSRSGLIYSNGAQTRIAAILNAVFVAIIIAIFGFLVTRIPLAALAALLLAIAVNLIRMKQFLLCVKATSSDAIVTWTTLLACIFLSFDLAFYIGIFISIATYLNKSAVPQLIEFEVDESGELRSIASEEVMVHKKIRIIKVEGELFFGAADIFQSTLKSLAEDDTMTRVIVLQLKNARDIDATGCLALEQLCDYLRNSGRHLIACGITDSVWEVLGASDVVEHLGRENLFIFDDKHPHHYLQKALQRAEELSKQTLDVSLNIELETKWASSKEFATEK